jgi:hypothetical protein
MLTFRTTFHFLLPAAIDELLNDCGRLIAPNMP